MQNLAQKWDLDHLFPGGSDSKTFHEFLTDLECEIEHLQDQVLTSHQTVDLSEDNYWVETFEIMQHIFAKLWHSIAFVECLTAQNTRDPKAMVLRGRTDQLYAAITTVTSCIDSQILRLSEEEWNSLVQHEKLTPISHALHKIRERANEQVSFAGKTLMSDLAVDGLHGWGAMYQTVSSLVQVPVTLHGETRKMSVGQAEGLLNKVTIEQRREIFSNYEQAWGNEAEVCATILNGISGFRLQVVKHLGFESVLDDPLRVNHMRAETLNAMWKTVAKNQKRLADYLHRKATLMGQQKLSWEDVSAPLFHCAKSWTYEEAVSFIEQQFRTFSPLLGDFTKKAVQNSWIESENRPDKAAGAFCAGFPLHKESRIFMTFSGIASNITTLAHELGHAFHGYVMSDLPLFQQTYPMILGETASTFSEFLVSTASLKVAGTRDERLGILEDRLQRSVLYLMNVHARYLFETRYYEAREKEIVSVEQLNQYMLHSQQEAFQDSLHSYHPLLWASKSHFYMTNHPFYNFPYTFGFLFSSGIYAQALRLGDQFEEKYIALLRDTGSMSVEGLAMKHLSVDVTQEDFWQSAIEVAVLNDVEEFLKLTM